MGSALLPAWEAAVRFPLRSAMGYPPGPISSLVASLASITYCDTFLGLGISYSCLPRLNILWLDDQIWY